MSSLSLVLFIALLILINAFYVAAEFALISVPLIQLHNLAKTERWARRLEAIRSNTVKQDRYLTVAQLGVTLASLGLGMYSEHAMAGIFQNLIVRWGWPISGASVHWTATILSLAILTYLHVVLGEMVPKTMALLSPLAMARFIQLPMEISSWILTPLVLVLNGINNLGMKLLGLPVSKSTLSVYSEEELSLMLEESKEEGLLGQERHDWCQHLLTLKDRTVRGVMVPRTTAVGLEADITIDKALKVVREEGYSRYPICRGGLDHIVGTAHVRDMFAAVRSQKSGETLESIARDCPKFPESLDLDKAFNQMRAAQAHLAAVVDEWGGVAGIVTLEDIVEEVFGEVFDEFDDSEAEPIVQIADNKPGWDVAGSVLLEDLSELTECQLVQEEVDTVSGLVMDKLGRLPVIGDKVVIDGVTIEVLQLANMVPSLCRVTVKKDDSSDEKVLQ